MKNPLLSSFVIVTAFWYGVLAIPSRALLHEIPLYALKGLWISLVGVFLGRARLCRVAGCGAGQQAAWPEIRG